MLSSQDCPTEVWQLSELSHSTSVLHTRIICLKYKISTDSPCVCPFMVPFLPHIKSECISYSYFLQIWKKALIRPLPKVTNPKEFKDMRLISILPALSKIECQLLPIRQYGFRWGISCATAMADVTDDLIRRWDENKISILVLDWY